MQKHHEAWLAAHPFKSKQWLSWMTREGFDVHHIDGDHDNNDPKNLCLIYNSDHMMLHNGGTRPPCRVQYLKSGPKGPRKETLSMGGFAYRQKQGGKTWREIGPRRLMQSAKRYAEHEGLPWPIKA